jgi:hypothetical protein
MQFSSGSFSENPTSPQNLGRRISKALIHFKKLWQTEKIKPVFLNEKLIP